MSFPSVFRIKKKKKVLNSRCLTRLCPFLMHSRVSQWHTHVPSAADLLPVRVIPEHRAELPGCGAGPHLLPTSHSASAVSVRQCQTPDSSHPLLLHGNQKFVPYVRDYFCFAGKFTCTNSLGSTYKQHCMVFVWHTSLCITICRSIHVTANGIISSFLRLSNTHCICIPLLDPFLSQ